MSFSGDALQYWIFIRSFENIVERRTTDNTAILVRLLQYCTGKAKRVIQCCSITELSEGYIKDATQ